MNKLELDGAMVAGNGDVGQRPTVATLMPPAATHVPVTSTMGTGRGLFTAAQWVELQRQSLIYNHMAASSPIPSYLLFSNINPAAAAAAAPTQAASSCYCCYNTPLLVHHYQAQQAARMSMLLQCMQQAVARRRCGRTDGKKWRCARDAEPDQKYCQRHLNRVGRTRPPPPARKQQNQHAAAAVDGHHRDRDKSAMTASAATHHTSHGNTSSGNTMREDDDDYTRGLLDFTGGVCLPEQRENRLSLNYDNIAELYCNRQVAATPTATASAASTATAMDDEAIDHGAAATWVGIGGPLGEALGLAVEIQWPAGSTQLHA